MNPPSHPTKDAERLAANLKHFEIVAAHFRDDFQLFWQQVSVFLIVEAGLISVAGALGGSSQPRTHAGAIVLVSFFGLALSVFWWWVLHLRLVLIEMWRRKVVRLEARASDYKAFQHIEKYMTQHRFRGPTHLTSRVLPCAFGLIWVIVLLLLLFAVSPPWSWHPWFRLPSSGSHW